MSETSISAVAGLKSVMEVPWSIITALAQPKAKTEEEVVFAK